VPGAGQERLFATGGYEEARFTINSQAMRAAAMPIQTRPARRPLK